MPSFTGFIRNTNARQSKPGAKKAWTAYSAEIHALDGKVTKIGFGFDQPSVGFGDYVTLEANEQNGYLQVDQTTIQRLDPPKQEEPKRLADTAQAASTEGAGPIVNRGADRQESIVMQHSQEMAIRFLEVLASHDALPFSKAAGKAATAKRFEEFVGSLDKLTVKFYNDSMTTRILATVQDMGVIDTSASSDLPTKEDKNVAVDDLDK